MNVKYSHLPVSIVRICYFSHVIKWISLGFWTITLTKNMLGNFDGYLMFWKRENSQLSCLGYKINNTKTPQTDFSIKNLAMKRYNRNSLQWRMTKGYETNLHYQTKLWKFNKQKITPAEERKSHKHKLQDWAVLYNLVTKKSLSTRQMNKQKYQQWIRYLDQTRAVAKGGGSRWNTLWHKTKGDADYKTHEGDGEQVETIRDRGNVRLVILEEGQVTWNERRVRISKWNRKFTRQKPKTRQWKW